MPQSLIGAVKAIVISLQNTFVKAPFLGQPTLLSSLALCWAAAGAPVHSGGTMDSFFDAFDDDETGPLQTRKLRPAIVDLHALQQWVFESDAESISAARSQWASHVRTTQDSRHATHVPTVSDTLLLCTGVSRDPVACTCGRGELIEKCHSWTETPTKR